MPCGTSCGAWPGPRTSKSRASFSSFMLLKEGAGFRKCPPRLERGSLLWKTGRCRSGRLRCRPCPRPSGKGFSLQEARGAGKTLRRGAFHGDAATGKGGLVRSLPGVRVGGGEFPLGGALWASFCLIAVESGRTLPGVAAFFSGFGACLLFVRFRILAPRA